MAGRSNRRRRQRQRRRTKAKKSDLSEKVSPSASSASSGSSSSASDRVSQRKIPLPDRRQQQSIKDKEGEEEEKPCLDRSRDPRSLRKKLLSILRCYYIDAVSRLPTEALKTALARGLLVGGHCYGPFRPVENIIINSIWYAAAFPFRGDPIDVAVISTAGIDRLANRSVDGLVASLRHHYPGLAHDDAIWHLCLSGADLHGAASSVRGAAPFTRTELEAVQFQVAAQAARHPKPAAFALFVTSVLPAVERAVLSLLAVKQRLCLPDILRISAMLLPFPLPDELPPQPSPREKNQKIIRIIDERRKCLKTWYQNLLDIADAALRKFAHQTGEHYHLHTIYGASLVKNEDYELDRYIHINFMAWRQVGSSSSACQCDGAVRFFAEADNPPTRDCPEECITLCCMLPQRSPCHVDNCYACMVNDKKIDHPETEMHFGGHPHKAVETENDFPSTVDVDLRFFDPDRDLELVQLCADEIAHMDAILSKLRSENATVNEDGTTCTKNPSPVVRIPSLSPVLRFEDDTDDEDISDEDTSDEDVSRYCIAYI